MQPAHSQTHEIGIERGSRTLTVEPPRLEAVVDRADDESRLRGFGCDLRQRPPICRLDDGGIGNKMARLLEIDGSRQAPMDRLDRQALRVDAGDHHQLHGCSGFHGRSYLLGKLARHGIPMMTVGDDASPVSQQVLVGLDGRG